MNKQPNCNNRSAGCINRRDDDPPALFTPALLTQPASSLAGPIAQSVTEYPMTQGLTTPLTASAGNAGKTAGSIIPNLPAPVDLKGTPTQVTKTLQPKKKKEEDDDDDEEEDDDEEDSDDEDSDDEEDDD
ncbi:hypothetical protein G6F56_011610 [Rhizopus delemar]|nr:hypothetical protein G6F56_011610 [Rhizopus delemar]